MKTENMKLLDLQTGKYLELGNDFYYGGGHIVVNKCNVGYQIYEAIQHKDSERLLMDSKDCPFAAELPLELKEICEKVGAVVYGGRYVLSLSENDRKIGDVVDQGEYEYHRYGYVAICDVNSIYVKLNGIFDIPQFQTDCAVGRIYDVDYEVIGNFFEEYSKQLLKKENKFDELKELLKQIR